MSARGSLPRGISAPAKNSQRRKRPRWRPSVVNRLGGSGGAGDAGRDLHEHAVDRAELVRRGGRDAGHRGDRRGALDPGGPRCTRASTTRQQAAPPSSGHMQGGADAHPPRGGHRRLPAVRAPSRHGFRCAVDVVGPRPRRPSPALRDEPARHARSRASATRCASASAAASPSSRRSRATPPAPWTLPVLLDAGRRRVVRDDLAVRRGRPGRLDRGHDEPDGGTPDVDHRAGRAGSARRREPVSEAVSCPTATFCAAVDGGGRVSVSTAPATVGSWSPPAPRSPPGRWATSSAPRPPVRPRRSRTATCGRHDEPDGGDADVDRRLRHRGRHHRRSCPTTSFCMISGDREPGVPVDEPHGRDPDLDAARHADAGHTPLQDISCPTATICTGIGFSGDAVTTTDASAPTPTWRYRALSGAALLVRLVRHPRLLHRDEHRERRLRHCATPTNPPRRPRGRPGFQISGVNRFEDAACPGETLCLAVDDAGRVLSTPNPTAPDPDWTAVRPLTNTRAVAVSCPSLSLCVMAGQNGTIRLTRNADAATPVWVNGPQLLRPAHGPRLPDGAALHRDRCRRRRERPASDSTWSRQLDGPDGPHWDDVPSPVDGAAAARRCPARPRRAAPPSISSGTCSRRTTRTPQTPRGWRPTREQRLLRRGVPVDRVLRHVGHRRPRVDVHQPVRGHACLGRARRRHRHPGRLPVAGLLHGRPTASSSAPRPTPRRRPRPGRRRSRSSATSACLSALACANDRLCLAADNKGSVCSGSPRRRTRPARPCPARRRSARR